jgi:predicted secreted protein
MPGAPGTEIWIFKTLMEGESAISLNCVCLDEEGSEEEVSGTFVLNVTVKG